MRSVFKYLLLLALLVAPSSAFAADVDECDDEVAECTCVGETTSEPGGDVTSVAECQTICSNEEFLTIQTYQVTCNIEGQSTPVGGGAVFQESQQPSTVVPTKEFPLLRLGVQIPGLTFTKPTTEQGSVVSNYIGEYVQAIYTLLLGLVGIIVVVLVMVGGIQWILAGGNAASISQAKKRIEDAIFGLVLFLAAVTIAEVIDPGLTTFDAVKIQTVESILYEEMSGPEGTGGADSARCAQAVAEARANGTCRMRDKNGVPVRLGSPTAPSTYACGYHFRDKDYRYQNVTSSDYPAAFGSPVYAPFSGRVTNIQGTDEKPGNRIELSGSGALIYLVHVKDFLNQNGTAIPNGTEVKKGDVIGHVGGSCCAGQEVPAGKFSKGFCTTPGTMCTSPTTNEACQCQTWQQSGNSTGPHVHITFSSGGNFLSCVE